MAQKPSIPKGTRDFSPQEVAKRSYIMSTIRTQFERYGFQPIETPSFENSSTLMGKYGEEGDRLIFRILDSGDYLDKLKKKKLGVTQQEIIYLSRFLEEIIGRLRNEIIPTGKIESNNLDAENNSKYIRDNIERLVLQTEGIFYVNRFEKLIIKWFRNYSREISYTFFARPDFYSNNNSFDAFKNNELINLLAFLKEFLEISILGNIGTNELSSNISEKALRYDLTVPFARYVVQHQNDIAFPFKRFQMQPVWRADRPQKGRFREFYQCDADVVGSDSLWQEVEFVQLYDAVFTALKLEGVTIKMNNRKILSGIAEVIGASDKLIDFTVALDKLDKIGEEGVTKEMLSKGITKEAIDKVSPLFGLSGSFGEQLETLKNLLADSETGMKGIEELLFINNAITALQLQSAHLQLDVTLARGLNYYTGAIFEVSAPEGVQMGSIGGGGRYADLTGVFGLKDVSGVGISFGLDRIYLVLEELGLFPEEATQDVQVLFINFGDEEALYAMKSIKTLRSKGISAVLYPDSAKMKKQMTYANRREIPFVILAGDQEMASNTFSVKNMVAGTQETYDLDALVSLLS